MSEPEVQPEPEPEPEPQPEPQPEPPKRGRGRPRKDPSAPAKKRVVVREPVVREPVVREPVVTVEEPVEEEDPVNKLARMIMQHEREQKENAMSRYDRLLGFA